MLDKVFPFKAMKDPYIIKGNPRFCTQYNNSVTGENIGPILSGTASWLTLAIYEALGIREEPQRISFTPIPFMGNISYVLRSCGTEITVRIFAEKGYSGGEFTALIDGNPIQEEIVIAKDGRAHILEIRFR